MKTSLQFGYSLVTYKKRPDRIFTIGTYSLFGLVFPCSNHYYFVIDGTDNFPAKFLINDACVMAKKPFSHAGIIRFKG